jgi:hypothetical protein
LRSSSYWSSCATKLSLGQVASHLVWLRIYRLRQESVSWARVRLEFGIIGFGFGFGSASHLGFISAAASVAERPRVFMRYARMKTTERESEA